MQGSFLSFIYNPHFKYGFIFIEFFTGILNDLSWYMALHIHRRDHGFESSGSQKIQAPLVASEWFMCLYEAIAWLVQGESLLSFLFLFNLVFSFFFFLSPLHQKYDIVEKCITYFLTIVPELTGMQTQV